MSEFINSNYLAAANCKRGPLLFNKLEQILAFAITNYGEIAEDDLELLEKCIVPGDIVVDVGANVGTHATAFAQMTGERGLVYAFEPHPCNFNILCGNIALRGTQHVFPIRAMVGNANAIRQLPLVAADQSLNFGSLHALGMTSEKGFAIATPEMTVDSLSLKRCGLIKIDVEGDEDKVIAGAVETIERCSPIIFAECLDTTPAIAEASSAAVIPLLKSLGYSTYWHYTRLYRPNNHRGSTKEMSGHDRNVLALRKPNHEITKGLTEA